VAAGVQVEKDAKGLGVSSRFDPGWNQTVFQNPKVITAWTSGSGCKQDPSRLTFAKGLDSRGGRVCVDQPFAKARQ
jgi:hypothetical protein